MNTKRLWLNVLEWAVLGAAIATFTSTEEYQWTITIGLLLLPAAIGLRWLRTRVLLARSGLELPLVIFLASAGVATCIAVDQMTALLQLARMLGALVLFYAVIQTEPGLRPWLAAGLVLLGVGLAIYWPLQHDFQGDRTKFSWIAQAGTWLTGSLPQIPGPSIHPNVAAGSLAPGLPFLAAFTFWAGRRRLWLVGLAAAASLLITAGLILTSSRGAWLGCAATLFLAGLVWVQRKWFLKRSYRWLYWGFVLLIGLVGLVTAFSSGAYEYLVGVMPDPTGTMQSRVNLWQQGLLLIGDYPFTGSGLMGFRFVYAIYGILIHVPLHDHLHNTYLEVGLEQGLPGLLSLLSGMVVVGVWAWRAVGRRDVSPWGWAGLAALSILAVHGIVDVVFYVTRTLPLVGFIAGMAYLVNEVGVDDGETGRVNARRKTPGWLAGLAAIILGGGLLGLFYRPVVGAWYANLGAVEQTRLELREYSLNNYDDLTLDEVRRGLDLSLASTYFKQALAWNVFNRTAAQRMAQIALSQGDYAEALELMQDSWDAGRRDEITRLLMGDALVARGDPLAAAEVVRGLSWALLRINGQAWDRYYQQGDYERAAFAWQAVLALDPTDNGALQGLELLDEK